MGQLKLTELSETVAFCDPSGGKSAMKRTGARSAIAVVASDAIGRVFVLHTWVARCSTDKLIEMIFQINTDWRPRRFGIEANAMQSLFADALTREARLMGHHVPILPVHQPTKIEKTFRIRAALQPLFGTGRLLIPKSAHELRTEIAAFPLGATVDLIDATASAVTLLAPKATPQRLADDKKQRIAYLRATGAPPDYIDAVWQESHVPNAPKADATVRRPW